MSHLEIYRLLVADVPRPTRQQMEAFAVFVCGAHSWYEHLPLSPPGFPFQFFLDPGARRSKKCRLSTIDIEAMLAA